MPRTSRRPTPFSRWKLALTAGKIGFLLMTWSIITRFGLPASKPETKAVSNDTLVWNLMMTYDFTVIALQGPIEPELQAFQENAAAGSKGTSRVYLVNDTESSCELSKTWLQEDFRGDRTMISLEGPCDASLPIEPNIWVAYLVLLILEMYILNEFMVWDQMTILGLLSVIHSMMMVAGALNRAPDQTFNLWVIND
ncbi:hypothetical protein KR038_009964 [Drosophila bunnanda]|nr:hypothetical protein KR038_009964 [Drosophila bunnanda]